MSLSITKAQALLAVSHRRKYQSEFKPQPRWSKLKAADPHATYIGFHTTTPKAVASIVHSEFRSSKGGMLGKGVYFARSREDTIGKAQSHGACIIAEIRMGRVFEFNKQTIYPTLRKNRRDQRQYDFVTDSRWHDEYDTCYMNHEVDNKDEFCIKDPARQIIKWIVVIDEQYDNKVRQYGLDSEFDSTECYCV